MLGFVGQKWEQHIVAELDSALNKWIDSVPDHCECFPFAQLSVRGQKFCAAPPADLFITAFFVHFSTSACPRCS